MRSGVLEYGIGVPVMEWWSIGTLEYWRVDLYLRDNILDSRVPPGFLSSKKNGFLLVHYSITDTPVLQHPILHHFTFHPFSELTKAFGSGNILI